MNRYCIEIVADVPPRVYIGDSIAGGKVVAIKDDSPQMVTTKWLVERYGLSANTIADKLSAIAQGTVGKRLYPRLQAIAILDGENQRKVGRKRKN